VYATYLILSNHSMLVEKNKTGVYYRYMYLLSNHGDILRSSAHTGKAIIMDQVRG